MKGEILTPIELDEQRKANQGARSLAPKNGRQRPINNEGKDPNEDSVGRATKLKSPRTTAVSDMNQEVGQKLIDAEQMSDGPEDELRGTWHYKKPGDVSLEEDFFATGEKHEGEEGEYLGAGLSEDELLDRIDAKKELGRAKNIEKTEKIQNTIRQQELSEEKRQQELLQQKQKQEQDKIEQTRLDLKEIHGFSLDEFRSMIRNSSKFSNFFVDSLYEYLRDQKEVELSFNKMTGFKKNNDIKKYNEEKGFWNKLKETLATYGKAKDGVMEKNPEDVTDKEIIQLPYFIRKYNLGVLSADTRKILLQTVKEEKETRDENQRYYMNQIKQKGKQAA